MKVIETTEATDVIADYFDLICDTGYAFDESEILRRLNAHAVDAEPKQGKWQWTKHFTWECSECHENPTQGTGYVQRKTELFPFCPNCGARMGADHDTD